MGPKKAVATKKKEGNPENGGDLTPRREGKMYQLRCQSLQLQLSDRSEDASNIFAAKRELHARVDQITKDFEEEEKQTFEVNQIYESMNFISSIFLYYRCLKLIFYRLPKT